MWGRSSLSQPQADSRSLLSPRIASRPSGLAWYTKQFGGLDREEQFLSRNQNDLLRRIDPQVSGHPRALGVGFSRSADRPRRSADQRDIELSGSPTVSNPLARFRQLCSAHG